MTSPLKKLALTGLFSSSALLAGGEDLRPNAGADSVSPAETSDSASCRFLDDAARARESLGERGLNFQFLYIGEVFGNLTGGRQRSAVYEGLAEAGVGLDFDKMLGWSGGSFYVSGLSLHGRSPSELAGDATTASNIDGHDSVRLYEFWLQQNWLEDAFSVRAGAMLADKEFAGTTGGGRLLNSAFGWPGFISGSVVNTGPAFYIPALGFRLRCEPAPGWFAQAGIYDGDTFDSASGNPRVNPHGTHLELSSKQGAMILAETGYGWNTAATNGPLAGAVKLGGWYHTADFADAANPLRLHHGNFGAYVAAEQRVWRESAGAPEQGVEIFIRLGGSPEDRSTFAFVLDTGLSYVGPIPGRDHDKLTLGFVHADFADGRPGYRAFHDFEQVVELSYELMALPGWTLQPDLQWLHHPGGRNGPDDAVLIGLRSTITF